MVKTTIYRCNLCKRGDMTYGQISQHLQRKHKSKMTVDTFSSYIGEWDEQVQWKDPRR